MTPQTILRAVGLILMALSAMTFAACGSNAEPDAFPRVIPLGDGEVFANIVNSSLTIGPNRLMLQLASADDEPIFDAQVHLRFFDLNGDDPVPHINIDARFGRDDHGTHLRGCAGRFANLRGNLVNGIA